MGDIGLPSGHATLNMSLSLLPFEIISGDGPSFIIPFVTLTGKDISNGAPVGTTALY